ncbi:hypothetical protein [Kaistia soli]|uniref:hypothetical protein n=1 Tax=Kaistia soli TaxID=446684 RepID=UPI001AECC744|nr:hypothetical protein [Kaistia soli]
MSKGHVAIRVGWGDGASLAMHSPERTTVDGADEKPAAPLVKRVLAAPVHC